MFGVISKTVFSCTGFSDVFGDKMSMTIIKCRIKSNDMFGNKMCMKLSCAGFNMFDSNMSDCISVL